MRLIKFFIFIGDSHIIIRTIRWDCTMKKNCAKKKRNPWGGCLNSLIKTESRESYSLIHERDHWVECFAENLPVMKKRQTGKRRIVEYSPKCWINGNVSQIFSTRNNPLPSNILYLFIYSINNFIIIVFQNIFFHIAHIAPKYLDKIVEIFRGNIVRLLKHFGTYH